MAVIRSANLWGRACPPTLRVEDLPASQVGEPLQRPALRPGEPRGQHLYTVPAGKRAIIRSLDTNLGAIPPAGQEPTFRIWMFAGSAVISIRFCWWVDHGAQIAYWKTEDNWYGMIVLLAGWHLEMENLSTVTIYSNGSGHVLNEPT